MIDDETVSSRNNAMNDGIYINIIPAPAAAAAGAAPAAPAPAPTGVPGALEVLM